MRFWFLSSALVLVLARSFAPPPRRVHAQGLGRARPLVAPVAASNNKDPFAAGVKLEKVAFVRFLIPLGFVAQILFLVAANAYSGLDGLTEYGDLGNAWIAEKTDFKTMPRGEIMRIQGEGQQIWYNNVLRDLNNRGRVSPPLDAPYPKYAWH